MLMAYRTQKVHVSGLYIHVAYFQFPSICSFDPQSLFVPLFTQFIVPLTSTF